MDSSKGYGDGCGKLMYDSWGGKTALSWAEAKVHETGQRPSFLLTDTVTILYEDS